MPGPTRNPYNWNATMRLPKDGICFPCRHGGNLPSGPGNGAVMTTREHEQAELLSLAVHEFRTPVTVVVGYTKMLVNEQLGPVSERQRKVLLDIDSNTVDSAAC